MSGADRVYSVNDDDIHAHHRFDFAMSTQQQSLQHTASNATAFSQELQAGVLGGLAGGLVFGIMMAFMGMLPMVAQLIGASSALIGFGVHLGISAFIGGAYGLVARLLGPSLSSHLVAGVINGLVWWVLGALIAMPVALGMTAKVLTVGTPQVFSLVGHLVFGIIAAIVFRRLYHEAA